MAARLPDLELVAAVAPQYDVFVSYAKEDEQLASTLAERLESRGVACFYAPRSLRADEPDLHRCILRALASSRAVVLLWSPFVDKSEWLTYETATAATLRLSPSSLPLRIIVVDLDGPRLPRWIQVEPEDWIVTSRADVAEDIVARLSPVQGHENATPLPAAGFSLALLAHLAQEMLWDLRAWKNRMRGAAPAISPAFALARTTAEELERAPIMAALTGAVMIAVTVAVIATLAAWILAAHVMTYPHDPRGYVPSNVLMAGTAGLTLGLLMYVRVGVAPGTTAVLVGVPIGLLAAVLSGLSSTHGKYGAIGTGVTIGVMLGTAAAMHVALADSDAGRKPGRNWRSLVGVPLAAIATLLVGVGAANFIGAILPDPDPGGRFVAGCVVGAILAAPIAYAGYWLRHLQKRRRFRETAVRFGVVIWILLAVATAVVAAAVPFGNPFDVRAGLGVGLAAGAATGGVLLFFQDAAERMTHEGWAGAVAVLMLSTCAYPLLLLFPNVNLPLILGSLIPSAGGSFAMVSAWHALVAGHAQSRTPG